MKTKEELNLILTLIRKHNLPLSPILEYAIQEKIGECSEGVSLDDSILNERTPRIPEESSILFEKKEEEKTESVETDSNSLRIVEYGKRSIAVVGETKSHKVSLRAMGGYYLAHTVHGPVWVFPSKKRDMIQAYIDGDTSVVDLGEGETSSKTTSKDSSRYIIRVTYPDGRVFCSELVWETLVDVIKYARADRVRRLHITCMGDNLVSYSLNANPTYRAAQKSIGEGLYVCTYSSTDTKFKQIEKINKVFHLGMKVEKVYNDEKNESSALKKEINNTNVENVPASDRRIGYIIRLLPSQLEGEIIRTRVDKRGTKKLVVKITLSGNVVEINDLPFLYEIIQRDTKSEEYEENDDKASVNKTLETEPSEEAKANNIVSESVPTPDGRNGKTWTSEEDELIKNYFQEGKDYATIAELVGRTELAIKSRLAKLGLIEYTYGEDESSSELEVEHVYLDNKGNVVKTEVEGRKEKKQEEGWQLEEKENNKNAEELIKKIDKRWNDFVRNETEDKNIEEVREKKSKKEAGSSFSVPIGTKVRLLPSQIEGVVINHLISKSGERRIVIEKKDGSQMSAQDHPYLYEIVKKKTKRKRIGEARRDKGDKHDVKRKETERVNDGSIKEQFRAFLAKQKSESTVNGYTSTLDSAIRRMIKQDVDAQADSIFSYTTVEDVQICIDLLKETSDFRKENARRHNGLTAALNQYLKFVEERGKK